MSIEQQDQIHDIRTEMLLLESLQTPGSRQRLRECKRKIDDLIFNDSLRELIEKIL